jgi:hypothetical protein
MDLRFAAFSLIRSMVLALSKSFKPRERPRPPGFLGVLKLKGLFFIYPNMGLLPAAVAYTS